MRYISYERDNLQTQEDELTARVAQLESDLAACRRANIDYLEMLAQQYPAAQSLGGTYLSVLLREKIAALSAQAGDKP